MDRRRWCRFARSALNVLVQADAGDLEARGTALRNADDGCTSSCTDWYGNARPIFWHGRVFALMGYEIVEGREEGGRIREVARTDFTPQPETAISR